MFHSNRTTRTLRASATTVLCAALFSTGAMAAAPKLQTIAVTPNGKSISIGQKQAFMATGTFSNGSKQVLGPAVSDIAAGWAHTCAVLTSGGMECWGWNAGGSLGDGTTNDSLIPRPVKGISTATAASDSCAVLASGTVKCWGSNVYGQLGNGSTEPQSDIPVSVTGISTGTAAASGYAQTCALLASGAVKCWGSNDFGELGDGSLTESHIPVAVLGISTATAVEVAHDASCALLASGAVKCWGYNGYGQLGNGVDGPDSSVPVSVKGISTATALSLGDSHACALLASGAVKCWGYNNYGELGNGTNGYEEYSTTPVTVTGISTAIAITAGGFHTCAVLRGGSVKCWGDNSDGQLGDGTTNNSNIPVLVHEIYAPTRLAAGLAHTCALFSGGMMRCWGWNGYGQLGNRRMNTVANHLPVTVVGTPGVVWSSSDASKATITDRGVATGRAVGNSTITATTAGFINDNAVLTVH
jgi:alpha-tubulin suppressor-like RCC1 family protein